LIEGRWDPCRILTARCDSGGCLLGCPIVQTVLQALRPLGARPSCYLSAQDCLVNVASISVADHGQPWPPAIIGEGIGLVRPVPPGDVERKVLRDIPRDGGTNVRPSIRAALDG